MGSPRDLAPLGAADFQAVAGTDFQVSVGPVLRAFGSSKWSSWVSTPVSAARSSSASRARLARCWRRLFTASSTGKWVTLRFSSVPSVAMPT